MVTSVGETRLKLHGFFTPQAEGLLQFQAHPHMLITDFFQVRCRHCLRLRGVGHELPIRNTVVIVRSRHDILSIDLLRPPPDDGQPVLDGTNRYVPFLPVFHQCLDMFRLQRLYIHLSITQRIELVGDQRQLTLPIRLCSVTAVPIPPAELLELVVQFSHSVLVFR